MTIPPKSSLPPIFAEACKHRMRRVRIKTGGGGESLQMKLQYPDYFYIKYQLSGYQFSLQKRLLDNKMCVCVCGGGGGGGGGRGGGISQ